MHTRTQAHVHTTLYLRAAQVTTARKGCARRAVFKDGPPNNSDDLPECSTAKCPHSLIQRRRICLGNRCWGCRVKRNLQKKRSTDKHSSRLGKNLRWSVDLNCLQCVRSAAADRESLQKCHQLVTLLFGLALVLFCRQAFDDHVIWLRRCQPQVCVVRDAGQDGMATRRLLHRKLWSCLLCKTGKDAAASYAAA